MDGTDSLFASLCTTQRRGRTTFFRGGTTGFETLQRSQFYSITCAEVPDYGIIIFDWVYGRNDRFVDGAGKKVWTNISKDLGRNAIAVVNKGNIALRAAFSIHFCKW